MNQDRFERLVNFFKSKEYYVDLKTLSIWTTKCQYKPHKKKLIPCIKIKNGKQREYVRLTDGVKRYEYEMHEIISVWAGGFVIDKKCYFIDGDRSNYHPSNLYWHDKSENPNQKGKTRFTKEQIKTIKEVKFKHNDRSKPLENLTSEIGISRPYFYMIRRRQEKRINKRSSNV